MGTRLFNLLFIMIVIAGISFASVIIAEPETMTFTESIFCPDADERMVIESAMQSDGNIRFTPQCVNSDNVVVAELSDINVVLAAFAAFLLPLFFILIVLRAIIRRVQPDTPNMRVKTPSGVTVSVHRQEFDLTGNDADFANTDFLQMLEDARRAGKLSQQDYDLIRNKIVMSAVSRPLETTSNVGQVATLGEKLQQLQQAYEQGLITRAEYDAERQEILDEF